MIDLEKGYQITSAFQYIQQVFKECQRLIYKIDNQMAPEWENLYGNRITRDVSASLRESDRWILEALLRAYQSNTNELVNKCVAITLWGNDIEQPIITAGKIIYSDINKRTQWDIWDIWFAWVDNDEKNEYKLDGEVNYFKSEECDHISEAYVFSLPLVDIVDDAALIEKIVKPLKEL